MSGNAAQNERVMNAVICNAIVSNACASWEYSQRDELMEAKNAE